MEFKMREITILVPPALMRRNGKLNEDEMTRYYRWLAEQRISGLFLNGSTGEFTKLSFEEKVETVRIAKGAVGSSMTLIAGATEGSVELVLKLAEAYRDAGADAIAVAPPYFFKLAQSAIVDFMRDVAHRSPLPVYLYDIPAFTTPMDFDTILELSREPNIAGLKDSSRNFARFIELISVIKPERPGFRIMTGTEELLLASLQFGGDGATVATGGIEPEKIMRIVDAFREGDFETARNVQFELLPHIREWFLGDFPAGFRKAVEEKGFRLN